MWKAYGRKIIDAVFKKRSAGSAIRIELESKIQANSDRSDIRVFEAGLSSEQYGDYEQGSGIAAQEAESKRLISIAKRTGLFIEKSHWQQFGDRKRQISGESTVFLDKEERVVTKIRNPFAKSVIKELKVRDAIYEHLMHNILFPNTRYHFWGISEENGIVRIVLQQKYFSDEYDTPSQKMIDDYFLKGLGFHVENRYYYANDFVAITDVSAASDNVLFNGKDLFFIDPIIKFKQPAVDVLNHYYQLLK